MRTWISGHPRLVSAAALAAGVPVLVVGVLALTLSAGWALQSFLPPDAPLMPLPWAGGLVGACVALWFLVRGCLRFGGWQGVCLGLVLLVGVAVGFWLLGDLQQALSPQNSMAGVGSGILAVLLAAFSGIAALMAAVAAALRRRSRPVETPA